MREPQEFEGLVLFSKNFKEKDKLVKIFTEQYGKKMFFVRHANKKNSQIISSIQPFTQSIYIGQIKEDGLSFLTASKDVTPFFNIQKDIFLSAYATYILNLTDASVEDGTYDPLLYGFTKQMLAYINEGYDAEIMTNIFEVQILKRFGLSYNWLRCPICQESKGAFDFSEVYNGVLCEKHWYKDENRCHFHPRAVHFLRLFSQIKTEKIQSIDLTPETKQQIREALDYIFDNYVGINLKSKKFIDDMTKWQHVLKDSENKN